MKQSATTKILTLLALTAYTAAEPSSCLTQNYQSLISCPQPSQTDETLYNAQINHNADKQASCVRAHGAIVSDCAISNPSVLCGFSSDGPATAQEAWTSLISDAADWWTSNGEEIRSLRAECPDLWKRRALSGSPWAEAPMEVALGYAQCWANAQGETLSPTPTLGPELVWNDDESIYVGGNGIGNGNGDGDVMATATPQQTSTTGAAPTASDKDGAGDMVRASGCGVVGLVAALVVLVL